MMLITSLALLLVSLPITPILAGQIPQVNGAFGGVRNPPSAKFRVDQVDATVSPAATTPGKLRIVENSGVCETTPGVYQASGYGDLTSSQSIW